MNPNLDNAVDYHYDKFPPTSLNYEKFVASLVKATDAVARYDQMLKNMHNFWHHYETKRLLFLREWKEQLVPWMKF
jgi:hypothetical protein